MLPQQVQENYQEFKYALKNLETTLAAESCDREVLKENFYKVQKIFLAQMSSLNSNDDSWAALPRWQSFQTEIHRLLRLLEMDVMFLQASRSLTTAQSRLTATQARIKSLLDYCEALLQQE